MIKGFKIFSLSVIVLSIMGLIFGCGSSTKEGVSTPTTESVGAGCLICHGIPNLTMNVYTAAGTTEIVPLYVNIDAYRATKHGNVECIACHVGMNLTPPHFPPRVYGSWGPFSADDPNVDPSGTKTRNYFVVPAQACLNCHTDSRYQAFLNSDHATDKDRATLFDGSPRVATFVTVNGTEYQINETYNAFDCGSCHVNNNCAVCHWKSQVVQQAPGSPTDNLWTQYDSASSDTKAAMTNRWLDWTVNIASHAFNNKTDLTTSNEVCGACHSGFYDAPDSGDVADLKITGRVIEGHPQLEEMILSNKRGIHTTKPLCTDCHLEVHGLFAPQSASNGWYNGKTQCINCHPDKGLTGTHADVTCIGCHDAELTPMRDITTGMVVPETVDVNLEKSWPSHNLIKGQDIQCSKCHFAGNTIGAPKSVTIGPIHQ
jgi:hypothetical protein